MNRQILKAQVDVPLCVLLDKGPEGKETTSRGETQYQYTLNNDSCVMWLPPEARTAIMRTGAQAGDEIQIVKSLRGRNAIWNVQVLADAREPEPPPPAPTARMVAPRPQYTNGTANDFPRQDPRLAEQLRASQPQPAPAAQPTTTTYPMEDIMARCLEVSARANWRAYKAAQAAGIQIEGPNWEDVRAAAISIFIERSRNARENGGSR
jgi:hypothetical protein